MLCKEEKNWEMYIWLIPLIGACRVTCEFNSDGTVEYIVKNNNETFHEFKPCSKIDPNYKASEVQIKSLVSRSILWNLINRNESKISADVFFYSYKKHSLKASYISKWYYMRMVPLDQCSDS